MANQVNPDNPNGQPWLGIQFQPGQVYPTYQAPFLQKAYESPMGQQQIAPATGWGGGAEIGTQLAAHIMQGISQGRAQANAATEQQRQNMKAGLAAQIEGLDPEMDPHQRASRVAEIRSKMAELDLQPRYEQPAPAHGVGGHIMAGLNSVMSGIGGKRMSAPTLGDWQQNTKPLDTSIPTGPTPASGTVPAGNTPIAQAQAPVAAPPPDKAIPWQQGMQQAIANTPRMKSEEQLAGDLAQRMKEAAANSRSGVLTMAEAQASPEVKQAYVAYGHRNQAGADAAMQGLLPQGAAATGVQAAVGQYLGAAPGSQEKQDLQGDLNSLGVTSADLTPAAIVIKRDPSNPEVPAVMKPSFYNKRTGQTVVVENGQQIPIDSNNNYVPFGDNTRNQTFLTSEGVVQAEPGGQMHLTRGMGVQKMPDYGAGQERAITATQGFARESADAGGKLYSLVANSPDPLAALGKVGQFGSPQEQAWYKVGAGAAAGLIQQNAAIGLSQARAGQAEAAANPYSFIRPSDQGQPVKAQQKAGTPSPTAMSYSQSRFLGQPAPPTGQPLSAAGSYVSSRLGGQQ